MQNRKPILLKIGQSGLGVREPRDIDQDGNHIGGSWAGRLWRNHIRPNLGAIIGMFAGGPIGAILGSLIDAGVNVMLEGQSVSKGSVVLEIDSDEFPITLSEQKKIIKFINNELKPTIANLANKVDAVINVSIAKTTQPINAAVLLKANEVLQAIAVIKANNEIVLEFGEEYGSYSDSGNYTKNKVAAVRMLLEPLEQAVIQYVTDVSKTVILVEKPFTASTFSKIETMRLNWGGNIAKTTKRIYLAPNTQLNADETPVNVVQTSTSTNGVPDVVISSPTDNVIEVTQGSTKKVTNPLIKALLFIGVGYGVSKILK